MPTPSNPVTAAPAGVEEIIIEGRPFKVTRLDPVQGKFQAAAVDHKQIKEAMRYLRMEEKRRDKKVREYLLLQKKAELRFKLGVPYCTATLCKQHGITVTDEEVRNEIAKLTCIVESQGFEA